jgi:hypothetical protein
MPVIRIHLEDEEYAPVKRLADQLHVQPHEVAYAGLNLLMLTSSRPNVRQDIQECHIGRSECLPLWSDSARAVHAYEGRPDECGSECEER